MLISIPVDPFHFLEPEPDMKLYLEELGDDIILCPGKRYAFDACMSLPFEANYRFIEYNTLVFLRKHLHEALHEILQVP